MKRFLLVSMLWYIGYMHGIRLTEENIWEITSRWRAIFDEQLSEECARHPSKTKLETYKRKLLDITNDDAEVAGQLILHLCQGNLWDLFLERKDVDSFLAYAEMLTTALQQYINPTCKLKFPPKIYTIEENIGHSDLSERDYCDKLRRAFLAFTIIVSKMDYIARQ